MPYSTKEDLLLGDLAVSARIDKQRYVQDAADEIDGKIGLVYVVPVNLSAAPPYVVALFKRLNNQLASGRLIVTLTASQESDTLHAYGERLINDSLKELETIRVGMVTLPGIPRVDSTNDDSKAMQTSNSDEFSAVDTFEAYVMNGKPTYWQPGQSKDWGPTPGQGAYPVSND